ncbi:MULTISPECIES: peptidylprolyl isomerase [Mycobacteriaceae]|uniref:Peptidyl-prolyl cis-trans isomerase n=1 Tax=Mycolicibacterium neoaurum VKM Ac-1815D TaxID=700508 RepID=V5XBH0_MYCNE|nr:MULTISPECIES: peptidylprolyl isomerase [Mycobacteriaceae]AHC25367.1 peptidylprolyl isomerase [Mycolicibacterium neoaurum VKM Ac-1815D]AMO05842.1 peptidylprolyl isomerase [Mycolicibacterium neoaurum]AXK75824.1 peptidylprolyl isomerase [Mycolicibacterium neoaurum]KJQ47933.1 peptidylprolyl isomerase [Mycolicibacterium neoaurum]KUM05961.1 peptidylprolyl isomerase [Mycolicibacterium neoaurum]
MPTNEQRRAAAKRKLERQLERRAAQAKRQRLLTIVASAVGAVVVIGAVVATVVITTKDSDTTASASTTTTVDPNAPQPAADGKLPAFVAPAGLGQNCQYPAAGKASKPVNPPRTGAIPMDEAEVSVSMSTDQGNIGLELNNAQAPCTTNSFASLAQQGYFNDTPCHRLTTSDSLSVLQCGDPTGQGTGGPGYQFANEYPTNQYQPDNPALQQPVLYPRGTLAMANAGAGTNGSQFFLVYKDSQLPPGYTVFGTIDETGLATLDKIAAGGVAGGGQDGEPATKVMVKSIAVD